MTTTQSREQLRVVLGAEDPLGRRALRDALEQAGITVIAEPGDGYDAAQLTMHYRPDVLVMDAGMPRLDAIGATSLLRERAPDSVVVVLGPREDDELALRCLWAGAMGFLPKTVGLPALVRAVGAAAAGEPVYGRRFTAHLFEQLRASPRNGVGVRPVRSRLTSREWEA